MDSEERTYRYMDQIYDMFKAYQMEAPWADQVLGRLELFQMDLIYDIFRKYQVEAPWADQVLGRLKLLLMDAIFLKMFCFCLKTWDYDEQSLASMIIDLNAIWIKEHKGRPSIIYRLWDTWPVDAQHFHSLAFQLEGYIHQSKLHIEGCCKKLVKHSLMQCKSSSTFYDIWNFLKFIRKCMESFCKYRAKNIVPFKKQIDILKHKMAFLENSFMYISVYKDRKDSKKVLQFVNFVDAFAKSAVCLTCLYWARREANEEIAAEMNTFLFNMLQKFTPFAPEIIPLYIIGILNLQESDPSFLGEAVGSIIDFFFEHLVTVLKDEDYLILRDKLIFLFTFLTGSHREGDDDSIRSQIYDFLHLLLPFDEMKRDLSNKNKNMRDFMIKIEIVIANIIQIYCGFSDSWIRLEAARMDFIYLASVERELYAIERANVVVGQVQLYRMELRFLRMFLRCLATWDDIDDEEIRGKLSYISTLLQGKNGLVGPRLHAIAKGGDISNWHLMTCELDENILMPKLEIEAWLVNLYHLSFRCKPSACNIEDLSKFLDSILNNINDLVGYRADKIVPFKKQIDTLKEKLIFLQNFLKLTANCVVDGKNSCEEFHMFVQVIANDAAFLPFLYWAQEDATELNLMLSHLLQEIKPGTPDVARLYFQTLEAIYMQRSDSFLFGRTAMSFLDLFIEDPMKHDFQILRDDIICLLTFINDPPNVNAAELICSQMDVLFWEGVFGLLPFDDTKQDFFQRKVLVSDFMIKIHTINTNIRKLYCMFPDSSIHNFPTVVAPQFLDFLIDNLGNLIERMTSDRKYAPFAKHMIIKIEEGLISLRPFFNHIFEMHNELNDTWLQVVYLVHLTEHVISSCISSWFVFDHPIWYHMAYLSNVFERIKAVKEKLESKTEKNMYNARSLPDAASSEQHRSSEINEVVVGFEDEAEKIISKLTWGHSSLDTVSIVGMGGLGKTTIAKKVYGSSLVKSHFRIFAFCVISQDQDTKRILLDILRDIRGDENKFSNMTVDDLAHQLWKYLSRQKYLIVMDDIWDISAWDNVKRSFPDDKNGSRVMLTTRSRKVAEKCKMKCSPHHLRFLTEDESWELLRKRVFGDDISPPNLYDIGKLISKNCKGLPLAVAVIAGVLARTERNQSSWREIAERVSSYLYEGCMNILELSYKQLPNYLKPCLIYLGAYPQDCLYKVKQVILLWIAEGFVPKSKIKRIEDVARGYFHDLVDRSLVLVDSRSSSGEIKTIRVHDLIHDLCQTKCQEGNFFQLRNRIAASSSLDTTSIYNNNYRVSTENIKDITIDSGLSFPNTRSLLVFGRTSYHQGRNVVLKDLKLAQVLQLEGVYKEEGVYQRELVEELTSLVHVRHIEAVVFYYVWTKNITIPSSIANLWNMQSLIMGNNYRYSVVDLPETLWRMKSLRHVKVSNCKLKFSDSHDENEACPKLDKVVSFSKPVLSNGKDVERLLQRLPAVKELSCFVERSDFDFDKESIETLDFYIELESLKLSRSGKRRSYLINFPLTLKKLTLGNFQLPWTAISTIAQIHCLQVLKLRWNDFPGPILEMEDVAFQNLKFFELYDDNLIQWNVENESFPCLEHLLIRCGKLQELPPCFGEIATLKRIVVRNSTQQVESSAHEVGEQQMELGNEIEVSTTNGDTIINLLRSAQNPIGFLPPKSMFPENFQKTLE